MAADRHDRTSRPTHSRLAAAALLSLLAVLGTGAAFAQAAKPSPQAAPAAAVKTVTVRRGDIQDTVDAAGKLQLYKWADAYPQIGGQVKDVLVALGDVVQADQALVEIAPSQQAAKTDGNRARMARLQADLADQRAQFDFAQLQFKRQTQLKAQNATREDAFESARMNASSASARVDAIMAQIHELEIAMKADEEAGQKTLVKAPMTGTVVALAARPGQTVVAAQAPVALVRIADLSSMTVAARVAENDVTRLRPGMTASFTTPGYPGKRWTGALRQVVPVPADGTGEQGKLAFYIVLFEVKNPGKQLMSGMSAQVQFVVARARDTLLLPADVLGEADEEGLYDLNVLDATQGVGKRRVKIGMRTARKVQVLSGLAAGDKVLLGPAPQRLPAQDAASVPSVAAGS